MRPAMTPPVHNMREITLAIPAESGVTKALLRFGDDPIRSGMKDERVQSRQLWPRNSGQRLSPPVHRAGASHAYCLFGRRKTSSGCIAAAPNIPPIPIDSTRLVGTSIKAPFSLTASYNRLSERSCSAVGLSI